MIDYKKITLKSHPEIALVAIALLLVVGSGCSSDKAATSPSPVIRIDNSTIQQTEDQQIAAIKNNPKMPQAMKDHMISGIMANQKRRQYANSGK